MVGTTLVDLREHIEALASDDGEYYVVCGRTGERPVPISSLRFDRRMAAQSAARAAEQYRTALRRYDPQVPYYDLIVCQHVDLPRTVTRTERSTHETYPQTLSQPVVDRAARDPERRALVEFCHSVAAAVFETLSNGGYEAVERTVMDAYFELAETVDDPDELCLCLLESMATELEGRLSVDEQAEVLSDAATRLGSRNTAKNPLAATLTALTERGLLGSYTRSPWSVDLAAGDRSVVVTLSNYALSARDGRLPVLPLVLELYRRQPADPPTPVQVVDRGDSWRIRFATADTVEPVGLTSAPIDSEVSQ
jgi:hypothetical protein